MLHEFTFPSYNERDQVFSWIYAPAAYPKGVIQLVHGFGEHSRRYLHMVSRFVEAGYIVAADDHVGHGKTAMANDTWGDWGDKGFKTMVEDEHRLKAEVEERYPDLPYLMFGHSMGSVITREFMASYGAELTAATICGTCGEFPTTKAEAMLRDDVRVGKGAETDTAAMGVAMGWMGERCGEIHYGNEWICDDPYVQADHAADPFDAFTKPTTNQSFLYFLQMIDDVTGLTWARKVPTALPVYSIAGDQDPFGSYGEGPYLVSNWLVKTGHADVTTQVYSGYRHEIHNYPQIRDQVVQGVVDFFDAHVPEA